MQILESLAALGSSMSTLWATTLLWTLISLLLLGLFSALPRRLTTLHHDLRLALLAALPSALTLAALSTLRAPAWIPALSMPEIVVGRGSLTAPAIDVVTSPGIIALGALTLLAASIAVIQGIRFLADWLSLRCLLSRSTPIQGGELGDLFSSVLTELELRPSIQLRESAETAVPFVAGIARPVVVLPVDRPAELGLVRMILLHECAHLARNDHYLAPLSRAILAVFGFHPLVGRLSRSVEFFREAACDGFVVHESNQDRKSYASLLFSIAQGRIMQPVPALSIHAPPSQLKQRIHAMSQSEPIKVRTVGRLLAVALLLGTTVIAACSDPAATDSAPNERAEAPGDPAARVQADGSDVFVVVEQMPEIKGGIASVVDSIRYPEEAKNAEVEGKVFVSFIVDKDGFVRDAAIERSVHPALDAEALRVVGDLMFEPGVQRGQAVDVKLTLPISFRLQ